MLIPLDKKPVSIIEHEVEDTVRAALKKWSMPEVNSAGKGGFDSPGYGGLYPKEGQIGRADLRPDDVGIIVVAATGAGAGLWDNTTAFTIAGAATGWVTEINVTTDEDAYLVIEGIRDRSVNPNLTEMQISIMGMDYPVQHVTEMFDFDPAGFGWLPMPIVCPPKTSLKVQLRYKATVAAAAELVGLIGEVIAKQAYLQKAVHAVS
jgi:hypothetical protein